MGFITSVSQMEKLRPREVKAQQAPSEAMFLAWAFCLAGVDPCHGEPKLVTKLQRL